MHLKGKTLTVFGCGYVGTHFVTQALERGLKVTALTRNPQKVEELQSLGVHKVIQAHLQETEWHNKITKAQDYVVNCVSASDHSLEGYRTSYVRGQASLLAWAKRTPVGRYIYTSSTGVYPQHNGETVTEESSTAGASPTGQILLEAEELIQNTTTLPHWIIFRLGGIYGPGRCYLINKLKAGDFAFDTSGDEFINYIHLDDICNALWTACEGDLSLYNTIYNLTDGHPVKKRDWVNCLVQKLNLDPGKIIFTSKTESKMNKKVENKKITTRLGLKFSQKSVMEYASNLVL